MEHPRPAAPRQQPSDQPMQARLDRADPLAKILDLADDAIISVNRHRAIILFNRGAEKMFGYEATEVLGEPLDILLPSQLAQIHRAHIADFDHSSVTARRMGGRSEILVRRKDGTEFPAEASISKVAFEGEPMFTVIMRDVTQRTIADEKLRASLREKEVLLKEIHHRVKNNLQVVSSLLGLQSRAIADATTKKQFQESQYRIQSMALLHEVLYRSDNLASVDFSEYIRRLAEQLFRSYGASPLVELRIDLAALHFHVDAAVPCGLIVNELLSNALKYAFPGSRRGEVRVELRETGSGMVHLAVADDGVGLRPEMDWQSSHSLGLRLVRTLAQQIGGSVTLNRTAGTRFQIAFPKPETPAQENKPSHA